MLATCIIFHRVNGMELAEGKAPIHNIQDEVFTTVICPYFDRQDRDTLKCTCIKYHNLVLSQEELNKKYHMAKIKGLHLHSKQSLQEMELYKKMGGLAIHQEVANAIKNNKGSFATQLIEKQKLTEWTLFYNNIEEAVKTSTIESMLPIIRWLLDTRKPKFDDLKATYEYIKTYLSEYPETNQFLILFQDYKASIKNDYNPIMYHRPQFTHHW